MGQCLRCRNPQTLALRKIWICVAAVALVPLAANASMALQTTIVENGAPISIDQCVATVTKTGDAYTLDADVDFTNIGQQTVVEVRFGFKTFDARGLGAQTYTDDHTGSFVSGIPVDHTKAPATAAGPDAWSVAAVPNGSKVSCSVVFARFDDGSTWNDTEGPAGNGTLYTPLPSTSTAPTPGWRFPDATPPAN